MSTLDILYKKCVDNPNQIFVTLINIVTTPAKEGESGAFTADAFFSNTDPEKGYEIHRCVSWNGTDEDEGIDVKFPSLRTKDKLELVFMIDDVNYTLQTNPFDIKSCAHDLSSCGPILTITNNEKESNDTFKIKIQDANDRDKKYILDPQISVGRGTP